ncbi:UNVERIFIED_CONTAM: hypothetical protein GTU68_021194 [Idotea baltica]|nr:hypothetical protein [Idotea baltica]
MIINFFKYDGTGNDFILIDNRNQEATSLNEDQISKICHRRFGIGADGVILLQSNPGFDFEMKYYNANGKEGSMCGNGARCITAFAKHLNIIDREAHFLAVDGAHEAKVENGLVHLKMQDVSTIDAYGKDYLLDTGSPHYIQFVASLDNFDVEKEGKAIRHHADFDEAGINVNFVEIKKAGHLKIYTFERGVEAETYSCGTGATAAAITTALHTELSQGAYNYHLTTKGGALQVQFTFTTSKMFEDIYLIGPANYRFKGQIEI